ncbi:MAG: NUDIX hydrolase [Scardovia wiggsiae]|uniref:NUDIX hydrolase n=1 Tax=Scardovia wiggsiae TaxID=230143 RepID=UPI001CAC19AD|nr:NUDIX hydrolase [Scardovia wiggsiae]
MEITPGDIARMVKRAMRDPKHTLKTSSQNEKPADAADTADGRHHHKLAYFRYTDPDTSYEALLEDDDDTPVYSSQTPHSSVEIRPHGEYSYGSDDPHSLLTAVYEELLKEEADTDIDDGSLGPENGTEQISSDGRSPATPAVMAGRRENSATFPSLDNRNLPIAREYSAGGLIFDGNNHVAIIARHSRSGHLEWCLPKGHIEKGETPEQTAVREVHEETGILGEVVDSIATIDYWFTGTTQRVHKLVHHYVLRQTGGELSVEGDPDHEAEDAIWVDFDDLADILSYPNERRIVWLYSRKSKKAHETDE